MRFPKIQSIYTSLTSKFRSEAPVLLETNKKHLIDKATELNNWYTRIIGLDQVKLSQTRVEDLENKLLEAQENRREINRNLVEIRKKSNQIQDQIHKVNRQENLREFLRLMEQETETLREENDIAQALNLCDRAERDLFTTFTNAVRDSHEKQRAQLEYTKYFGIILSIVGSFLAFLYTTVRKHDLKKFIDQKLNEHFINSTSIKTAVNLRLDDELKQFISDQLNRDIKQFIDFKFKQEFSNLSNVNNIRKQQQQPPINLFVAQDYSNYIKIGLGLLCMIVLSKMLS